MGIKMLHTADLHLCSPFAALDDKKAREMRAGQFVLLSEIVSLAGDENVDAILIAGDLFDTATVPHSDAAAAAAILGRTKIPIFIAPGNHDPITGRSPYSLAAWPENVHIFRSETITRVSFPDFDVYGAAFNSPFVEKSLLAGFSAERDKPSVMVLHGEPNQAQPRWNSILPVEIAACGIDYLALGHVHLRSEPQKLGKTTYAFPGCPGGRGFDELGEKGVYLVTIAGEVQAQFVPLHARKFLTVTVELNEEVSPLKNALDALPSGSGDALIKLVLRGEFPPEKLDCKALCEALSDRAYYIKIYDETRLPTRVWNRTGQDSLTGIFLSLLQDEKAAGNVSKVELAARFGLAAIDGEEAPF